MIKKDLLKEIPEKTGVYFFKDVNDDVIYVGKSLNLRSRVQQYFNGGSHKTGMEKFIERIEFIECRSEIIALLLEDLSIKILKPHFNIRLRRFSNGMKLGLTTDNYPSIILEPVEKVSDLNTLMVLPNKYFANEFIDKTSGIFKIRTCLGKIPDNMCVQYTFGTCLAPCRNLVSEETYGEQVNRFKDFLKGDSFDVLRKLSKEMKVHADKMEFEDAMEIKDKIKFLERQTQRFKFNSNFCADFFYVNDAKYKYVFYKQDLVDIQSNSHKRKKKTDNEALKRKRDKILLKFRKHFGNVSYSDYNKDKPYYLFDRFNVLYPFIVKEEKTSANGEDIIIR